MFRWFAVNVLGLGLEFAICCLIGIWDLLVGVGLRGTGFILSVCVLDRSDWFSFGFRSFCMFALVVICM